MFPLNFEISTNNGKYKFNKNLVEILISDIEKDLSKDENLKEYHFDINDEQNVTQKIQNLIKDESVEFINSERNIIKAIIHFFKINHFQ